MVTHELDIAHFCKRTIVMRDGCVVRDEPVVNRLIAEVEMKRISAAEAEAKLTIAMPA
jgi:putative ABC transport system ATP-binding protein